MNSGDPIQVTIKRQRRGVTTPPLHEAASAGIGPSRGAPRHRAPGSTTRMTLAGAGAAVAVLTVAITISALGSDPAPKPASAERRQQVAVPPPPSAEPRENRPRSAVRYRGPVPAGWYQIRPVIKPDVRRCLVFDADQRVSSTVVQSTCSSSEVYTYRLHLVRDNVYQIRPRGAPDDRTLCVTVGTVAGARLYLTPCDEKAGNQLFMLKKAGRTRAYGTLYQLRPYHTREQNMCVGIDTNKGSKLANGAEAAQFVCSRSRSQRMAFLLTTT